MPCTCQLQSFHKLLRARRPGGFRPDSGLFRLTLDAVLALLCASAAIASELPPRAVRPSPDPNRAAPFQPTLTPSALSSPVDCVVLAPDSLIDVYQRLADYQTRVGIPTVVRGLSTVRAADPRSNDLGQAVRSFIKAARELWGARWAILAGDHDAIPMRYVRVHFGETLDLPSDAYYSDLDGTWDGNGNGLYGEVADSLDMTPDIAVGRLSARTRAQAEVLVSKALRYATSPIGAPLGKVLILAEVLFPPTWQPGQLVSVDGATQGESLRVRAPSCAVVDRYYENDGRYPGTVHLNKASALAALGTGYGVVHHIGHGAKSQISVGDDVLRLPDLASLSNGDSIALWIGANCASAAVDYECVAEEVVRTEGGGALAYVSATRDAWPGVSYRISIGLMDRLMAGAWTTLGEALENTRASLLPQARSETAERWGYFETVLLGDPVLPIWRCPPAPLTVTGAGALPLSAGAFSVSVSSAGAPVESALVVAWKSGEDYRTVLTDASGQAIVPFHPCTPGGFSLAVARGGHLPALDSLIVTSDAPAHFSVRDATVRDSLGGAGDGCADAGEEFALGGTLQNVGSAGSAGPVSISLAAISPGLEIVQGSAVLPSLGAGAEASLPDSLRVRALATPNAPRGEALWIIASDGVRSDTSEVAIAVSAASLVLSATVFSDDIPGGNGNGAIDPLENATYRFRVANAGSGLAWQLSVHAVDPAPGVAILDSVGSVGDLAPGAASLGPALRIETGASIPSGRLFDLRVDDGYGHSWKFPVDRTVPPAPGGLRVDVPGSDRISILWDALEAADLVGYQIYRALDDGSALALVTPVPLTRIPQYEDGGLAPLTRYRYAVAAIDSGGNESPLSGQVVGTTNPARVPGWPVLLGPTTASSSVCLADLDGDGRPEVLVGADYLYAFRADGSEWHDGDGDPATRGVFSTAIRDLPSSPAAADLDFDGTPELIAASWGDSSVAVWRANGNLVPGWPRKGAAPFWSTPAIGDIDGDGELEIVVGSNASRLYAWNADGSPVRGSSGALFVPSGNVVSSPAIADLDGDGTREIVFGTSAGRVYAIHADSSVVWQFSTTGLTSSSPAIGDVVPGGGLEVVFCSDRDSVFVLTPAGARAPGWPQPLELTPYNGRVPSPALARLQQQWGDPGLDVIVCGTDGRLAAWDPSGVPLAGFGSVHLGNEVTTVASPAVADLDGDGIHEILIGADDRKLYAYHADATALAGFPIETGSEVTGTPAVWDLDADGATEIVLAGWDLRVYAWRIPGTFYPSGMAWPMFHHDNWRTGVAGFPILTDVSPLPAPEPSPPPGFAGLWQNQPNPFNPSTTIRYAVPGPGARAVRITVYDVGGRAVATLVSRALDPGYYEARWDGRSDRGSSVSSGVYFYRAEIGAAVLTRKMALLR